MSLPAQLAFRCYRDRGAAGGWRWRCVAVRNGRIIADSGESYRTRYNAVRAANRLMDSVRAGRASVAVT